MTRRWNPGCSGRSGCERQYGEQSRFNVGAALEGFRGARVLAAKGVLHRAPDVQFSEQGVWRPVGLFPSGA
jgi:hypothetical protein